MLRLYNTLTRVKEEFQPMHPGEVRIYTCGPTVYDYAHIGNFRTFVLEDILRRYLIYKGYRVTQVMNLTDVDDKTIRGRARRIPPCRNTSSSTPKPFSKICRPNIQRAEHYPAATEHIPEMVALIQRLLERGYAYQPVARCISKWTPSRVWQTLPSKNANCRLVPADGWIPTSMRKKMCAISPSGRADRGRRRCLLGDRTRQRRPGWHIECSVMA